MAMHQQSWECAGANVNGYQAIGPDDSVYFKSQHLIDSTLSIMCHALVIKLQTTKQPASHMLVTPEIVVSSLGPIGHRTQLQKASVLIC
jgi:hypothetical protein